MATSTIKSSGGDYSSLSAWEAAKQANITGLGPEQAECYSFTDTSGLIIDGWTTTASDYIRIYAATSNKHNGVSIENSGSGYQLKPSVSAKAIDCREDFCRFEDLELVSNGNNNIFNQAVAGSGSDIRIDRCLMWSTSTGTSTPSVTGVANTNMTMNNCIVAAKMRLFDVRSMTTFVGDHITGYTDRDFGILADTETTLTNTYIGGATNENFWTGGAAPTGSNNASSDTSASTDYTSSLTSKAIADQYTAPSFAGSTMDWTIKSTAALIDAGTGTETTDIANQSRSGTRDIGAWEFIAAGGGLSIPVAYHQLQQQGIS